MSKRKGKIIYDRDAAGHFYTILNRRGDELHVSIRYTTRTAMLNGLKLHRDILNEVTEPEAVHRRVPVRKQSTSSK